MKSILIFISLLVLAAKADKDYTTQAFLNSATCVTPPTGFYESPILIQNSLCGPYGIFDLQMGDLTVANPTFTYDFAAYNVPYTTAKLQVNQTYYTSETLVLRIKAENILFATTAQADAELQIIMHNNADTTSKAVLSFLVRLTGSDTAKQNLYANNKIINSLTPTSIDISFSKLATIIKNKEANDQFLNFFTYKGTLTYGTCDPAVWFIYGGEIYMTDLTDIIAGMNAAAIATTSPNQVVLRNGYNSRDTGLTTPSITNSGGKGPITVQRLCYTGYFENHLGDNYGLWFGIVIILLFFIITLLMSDNPITDPEYVESCKTIHPLYSIWTVGNEIFTKKSRCSLVLMTITIHALFSSAWYRDIYPSYKGSDIIVFAIYSMLINWVYNYMLGLILRSYYTAKYHYCRTRDEAWDQKAQNRIFGYYAAVFATICIAWPFTVWNMGELHPEVSGKQSDYWVATFFVGLGLEFLFFDIIIALLARSSNFLRNIIRRKGYMYDKMCHDTYLDAIKMD